MIIRIFLRGLLILPLSVLVFILAGVYTLRTTVLMPEFITGQLAAVQVYDHLYDEMVDTVLPGAGQVDSEAVEPPLAAMLEAGRYHVTIYLSDKIEGFIIDLYHWLEVVDAPAPVLDLTDLGQLSQPIEAELTRNNALTPQTQELLRLIIGRAVPEESFSLASIWAGNPDTLRNVERVRAARQQLPLLTGLLAAAVFLTALLILLLGSGWGSRLRGLGLALLPAAVVMGALGLLLTIALDGRIEILAPTWPPTGVTMSAGLAQPSWALVVGIIGGIGEQVLRAAIVTFSVAVGFIAGSLADLL